MALSIPSQSALTDKKNLYVFEEKAEFFFSKNAFNSQF
jgi:hypothetical protein